MIKDLVDESDQQQTLECDVCIVGAGAAGITLALEFEKMGIDTILLEGGGIEFPNADELDLYDAKLGDKSYPVGGSRLRFLGGSTNHWGGWSRALDDFDLAEKPYFDHKGWPISREELFGHYDRAAEICEIPNFEKCFNGYYHKHIKEGVVNWSGTPFVNKFFVFSPPTRFGTKYQPYLSTSKLVRTFLHANATQLLTEKRTIKGVVAKSLNGKILTVHAKKTILAMGGLENPRFLLNNRTDDFTKGVGNHSDWLGRGFMDHPGFRPISLLLPTDLKYKRHSFEGCAVMPVISMNKEFLLKHEMNNFCILLGRKKDDSTINKQYAKNPWFPQKGFGNYEAQFIFEPSPNRNSRVTLTPDTDLLGQQKLKLDWQFNQRDFHSVEKVVQFLIQYTGQKNLGRIRWHKFFTSENIQNIGGGMHHAGTTKMALSASDGVVDVNCKVHQTEGLYIAGNSVFPHVGFSNPTITITALAVRLSKHIRSLKL